jgi:signal transduction histidine kinase
MTEPGRLLAGTLTASLAHDLRNVLAVIRTAAFLATQPERTPRELEKIARNADRGLALIELVLGMVRGEPPERAPFEPLRALRDAAEEYRGMLEFELPAMLPEALGVAPLLTSAFVILLDNAQGAGAQRIRVHSAATDAFVENSAPSPASRTDAFANPASPRAENASLTLFLADDGPGIPPEMTERIFEAEASARAGGTGLGLWFARYALEQMGGALTLGPVANSAGASFQITLPRAI